MTAYVNDAACRFAKRDPRHVCVTNLGSPLQPGQLCYHEARSDLIESLLDRQSVPSAASCGSADAYPPSASESRTGRPGDTLVIPVDEHRWMVSSRSHPGYYALVTFNAGVSLTCTCTHGQAVGDAFDARACRHKIAVAAMVTGAAS